MFKHNKNSRKKLKKPSNFSAQHLLISKRLIHDMIDLARIQSTDTVLDIGAGTGALTFPLAEKAAQVLAIETDPAFIDKLFSKIKDGSNIRVKPSDFLEVPLPKSPFASWRIFRIRSPQRSWRSCWIIPACRCSEPYCLWRRGQPNVLRQFRFEIRVS